MPNVTSPDHRVALQGRMARPDAAVLQAIALTKTYRMGALEVRALRGVDLALTDGEFLVLLGPSGSGKSTLLNILGGLDAPTSGRVFYRGQELSQSTEAELTRYRRDHVGFVFQFYNLIPSLTARENVALVTEIVPDPFTPDEVLLAIPVGLLLGAWLTRLVVNTVHPERYRFPVVLSARTYAFAVVVVLVSSAVSSLLVRRRLDRLDLIGVLKTRE